MSDISKQYSPKEVEDSIYRYWQDNDLFSAKPNPDKRPFSIVIPPPNVTGILHMGHALNNTYQDILIRLKRMQGFESLWMPGTDHAGIATQNVVEKAIAKEGLRRQDLGREKFIERVWQWKEEYGSTIVRQLKKLGASCDWTRIRFTMDEEYSKSVRSVFVVLWNKGLVYQGDKVINWCPRCQTALSDEEAVHHPLEGNLYYLKYPIEDAHNKFVVVATTRPETMLGDTAVAVNPKDKRYKSIIGKMLILPLANRRIGIISDNSVDMKFGTGAVKVTPAHDPNDYLLGKKHGLEFINVMHPDARMNDNAGDYKEMDRFEARQAILKDLEKMGLLDRVEPHDLSAGHCYRCQTIIEPYLSRQWFVKMKPLANPAIEAVKSGKVKFYPKRWTKVYLNWMENIQDWCISRQIWWGHRIPVWYCLDCKKAVAATEKPGACRECKSSNLMQDDDVLDTWFSSWLWPFATFYWPCESQEMAGSSCKKDLRYFYPTSALVTAPEIIFFWVARMIMAGYEFMGKEPFKDVFIHGTVRDIEGKKMSKSLGNIIDPLAVIDKYGADALRFSLMSLTSMGQDVYLSEQKFEFGRNFANKLWNASRFSLMNIDLNLVNVDLCVVFGKENLRLPERWILSRFYSMLASLEKSLASYRFSESVNILYEFIWHEFCDWYIELAKPSLCDKANLAENRNSQIVLYKVLEKTLRCLHPFMPFITEEIWQKLNSESRGSIMAQQWPHIQKQIIDKGCEHKIGLAIEVISAIRNLRSQIKIAQTKKAKAAVFSKDSKSRNILGEVREYIVDLANLDSFDIQSKLPGPAKSVSAVAGNVQIFLVVDGLIDTDSEISRLDKEINMLSAESKAKEGRLSNKEFLRKAPQEVVVKEKEALLTIKDKISCLRRVLDELKN